MNNHVKGVLLVLAGLLLFSTIGVFSRLTQLPTLVYIFYYTVLGVIIYFLYFLIKRRLNDLILKKDRWLVFASAVVVFITIVTFIEAYRLTTFSNSVILHYTAPLFAIFFAFWLLKEKPVKTSIIAILVSFIGLIILMSNEISLQTNMAGVGYALVSGFFYGILIVLNKRIVTTNDYGVVMFYQIFIGMLISLPFVFILPHTLQSIDIAAILGYTLVLLVAASLMYLRGIQYIRAQDIGIISYVEPLAVVLIGIFFYSEVPTIRTLIGGLFILFAGYMVIKYETERKNNNQVLRS